jgi:Ni2+-binding GTPase involved in maturation of urease and hydrogenase
MTENYFDRVLLNSPVSNQKNMLNQIEQLKNQVQLLTITLDSNSSNEDEYLTEKQVCEILNRNTITLWRYRKKKILNYYRLAGIGIR